MKKILWLIIFVSNAIYSQTTIKGNIFDSNTKAIPNSSVLILQKATNEVITYAISDSKGFYSFTFSSSYNEIDIQVRCMSYENITETIKNNSNTKNFILNEKFILIYSFYANRIVCFCKHKL